MHNQRSVLRTVTHSSISMLEDRNEPRLTCLKPCVHNCMYKQGQPWNLLIPNTAVLRHSGIHTGMSFSKQGWSHRILADTWCWWCTCPSLGWKLCTPPGQTLAVPGLCPSQLNLQIVVLDSEGVSGPEHLHQDICLSAAHGAPLLGRHWKWFVAGDGQRLVELWALWARVKCPVTNIHAWHKNSSVSFISTPSALPSHEEHKKPNSD